MQKRMTVAKNDSRDEFGLKVTKKRFREYWAQTDEVHGAEAGTQTDGSLGKEKKKKKWMPERKSDSVGNKASPAKAVFADADALKAKMRAKMIQPQYSVTDFYYERGLFQHIARSQIFEFVTLFVIGVNAIWISVDTDYNNAVILTDAHPVFQIAEHTFCAYFFFEISIRFGAFQGKLHAFGNGWFVFDSILVTIMVIETWIFPLVFWLIPIFDQTAEGGGDLGNTSILRILRLVRMLRVSRMARLIRRVPELLILMKGIGVATRSVFVFFILWAVIIYVFGILFRQLVEQAVGEDPLPNAFETVPASMNTLLLKGVLPSRVEIFDTLASLDPVWSPILWPLMLMFVALTAVCIMFMLIGVLCEVIAGIAGAEKEGLLVGGIATKFRDVFLVLDRDVDAPITKYEFSVLLVKPEIAMVAQEVGVDTVVMLDMVDLIFDDPQKSAIGITFEQFVEIILNMRGTNPATVKDSKEQIRVLKQVILKSQQEANEFLVAEVKILRDEMWELHAAKMRQDEEDEQDADED